MKSSPKFNNISDKLKDEIPKLKPGQSVVFQLTNGVPNPEPDEKERSKYPTIYPKVQLVTKFRMFDKYADPYKDENGEMKYKGAYVEVGCVDSWKGDEPIAFRCFIPGKNGNGAFMSNFPGKWELKGGSIADEELYEILYLSPQRQGTPCPDASVEQIFKIVSETENAKVLTTKFDRLSKVIDILKTITADKAREVMSAVNQPMYQDDEVALINLKDWAKNNVDDFIAAYESPLTPIKSLVKEAMVSGKLDYDLASGDVKLGKTTITNMRLSSYDDFIPEFSKWVNTAENGKSVLQNIKSQIEKKEVADPK